MDTIYKIKEKALSYGIDAQLIGEELEKIRQENNGVLKPIHVVEAAEDRNHLLHPIFDWNDESAAKKHRLQQARTLINSIEVIIIGGPPTQGFVSVTIVDSKTPEQVQKGYVDFKTSERPEHKRSVMQAALTTLKGWLDRNKNYDYFEEECKSMEKIINSIESRL